MQLFSKKLFNSISRFRFPTIFFRQFGVRMELERKDTEPCPCLRHKILELLPGKFLLSHTCIIPVRTILAPQASTYCARCVFHVFIFRQRAKDQHRYCGKCRYARAIHGSKLGSKLALTPKVRCVPIEIQSEIWIYTQRGVVLSRLKVRWVSSAQIGKLLGDMAEQAPRNGPM
mmetsp:Transcript_84/g.190  ORF Transcript_84/g.190 Transcript_84/m.190 type:complete len:173 (-) Transcript_84:586-1104(-)